MSENIPSSNSNKPELQVERGTSIEDQLDGLRELLKKHEADPVSSSIIQDRIYILERQLGISSSEVEQAMEVAERLIVEPQNRTHEALRTSYQMLGNLIEQGTKGTIVLKSNTLDRLRFLQETIDQRLSISAKEMEYQGETSNPFDKVGEHVGMNPSKDLWEYVPEKRGDSAGQGYDNTPTKRSF